MFYLFRNIAFCITFSIVLSFSYADEIHLLDGKSGKGKVTSIGEQNVGFIKEGNKTEVKISNDFINYIVINGDTTRIIQPPKDTTKIISPIAPSSEEIKEQKKSDSIRIAIRDSTESFEYTIKLAKLDKAAHSAFLSWTMTFPLIPAGQVYNREYVRALILFVCQSAALGTAIAGYKNNGAAFMIGGIGFTGTFLFSKFDAFNSAVRYNKLLAAKMDIYLPNDYHFVDFILCLSTSFLTIVF